jgi:phage-related protein
LESKNGVKLALDHKVSAQPRFQANETRTRAVHHFLESKNGVKLALDHKVSAQPRFQGNETRTRAVHQFLESKNGVKLALDHKVDFSLASVVETPAWIDCLAGTRP